MQRLLCLLLSMLLWSLPALCQPTLRQLRTEDLDNPLCIDSKAPRFSWLIDCPDRNELQTDYEIKVFAQPEGKDPFWSSGKVTPPASTQVVYTGPALQSGKRYFWQVRIWDNKDRV